MRSVHSLATATQVEIKPDLVLPDLRPPPKSAVPEVLSIQVPVAAATEEIKGIFQQGLGGHDLAVKLVKILRQSAALTVPTLRKCMTRYWKERVGRFEGGMQKPDGNDVEEMYRLNPWLFRSGPSPLPPGSHTLNVVKIKAMHRGCCPSCSREPEDTLHPQCYFNTLLRCITHGWCPPIAPHQVRPCGVYKGNYETVAQYSESADKEIGAMLESKIIEECADHPQAAWTPLGVVIKNSDMVRAKVRVGIEVTDQASLTLASNALIALGDKKIGCRPISDCTASGVNGATPPAPFRYPSFANMLAMVYKNCVVGVTDVSRYFHTFPLAVVIRGFFMLMYGGKVYRYARCCFGYSLCPYYCSTWSAEFRRWFVAMGVPIGHMVDDFATVGAAGTQEAQCRIGAMEWVLKECGFSFNSKRRFGQQEVLLGIRIDTVAMTLSFDPVQCAGMTTLLTRIRSQVVKHSMEEFYLTRHICGKLNWFSEVVQSGRCHTRSWWIYLKYNTKLEPHLREELIQDTDWWIALLQAWEEGRESVSYPIWSGPSLIDEDRIYLVRSDASGTDGYGYYHGRLSERNPEYCSEAWHTGRADSNSHLDEITALHQFLCRNAGDCARMLLVWITDSESAAHSLNSGRASKAEGQQLIRAILENCDSHRITILALWLPREENVVADYLSHFATYLCRDRADGRLTDLWRGVLAPASAGGAGLN